MWRVKRGLSLNRESSNNKQRTNCEILSKKWAKSKRNERCAASSLLADHTAAAGARFFMLGDCSMEPSGGDLEALIMSLL